MENSLDANAEHVKVVIRPHELRVIDDGEGMSKEKLESLSVHIGLSEKRLMRKPTMGEKAIGLLSFMLIGDVMEIVSQRESSDKAYKVILYAKSMEATAPSNVKVQNLHAGGERGVLKL